jgi:hypothetical protein
MNSETSTALADAFRELREAFGVSIQIEDAEILAVVSTVDVARELVEGGFAENGEVEAKILEVELPTTAENGKPAIYQGRKYRIAAINHEETRPIVSLRLRPVRGR